MRITHAISSLDPAAGGPPVVAVQVAVAQAAHGCDVRLLAQEHPARRAVVDDAIAAVAGTDRLRFHRVAADSRFQRLLCGAAVRELEGLLPDTDVLHLHGVWDPLLVHAAWSARRAGTPYVVTPHGMLDPWSLMQKRRKKQLGLRLIYRKMLNAAAGLHMLNDDETRLVKPLGLRAPMTVIPNGVDLAEIDAAPAAGQFRQIHAELRGRRYFLFLGRLHFKKGLDLLAEAFARFVAQRGEADLVVAGPDDGAQADFQQRVRRHGLQSRVHVVGPIYGRAKLDALREALAFVLPSRQEGFSMAVTEAMACGRPVVISRDCHFSEAAAAGAGLETPLEVEAIADAMLTLARDPARAAQMGTAARRLVEARYQWPHIAEQMIDLYLRAKTVTATTRG